MKSEQTGSAAYWIQFLATIALQVVLACVLSSFVSFA